MLLLTYITATNEYSKIYYNHEICSITCNLCMYFAVLYIYMYIYRKDVRKIQLSIYFEIDVYILKEENKFGQG